MKDIRLGESEVIFNEIIEEEKSELELDGQTIFMLERFAFYLRKYYELRIFYEPYFKLNTKDLERKNTYMKLLLKERNYKLLSI
jgi:hypothetical protein